MEALKTRMARLQMRMWRVQRILTKLRMAKGEMSFEEAVAAYVEKIGMEPTNAFIEVQRDSQNPSPPGREIIGEMVILEMRDEYQRRFGERCSLKNFHEALRAGLRGTAAARDPPPDVRGRVESAVFIVSMIPTPKGFGDLTVLGWTVFLAYFGAAALCYRAAASCWRDPGASSRLCRVWIALSAILVILGVNKQLDLHVWLNAYGRKLAESEGWYQNRGFAQVTFFSGLAVAVAGSLLCFLIWMAGGTFGRCPEPLLGWRVRRHSS